MDAMNDYTVTGTVSAHNVVVTGMWIPMLVQGGDDIDRYGYPLAVGEGVPVELYGKGCEYCASGWATAPGVHYRCECNPAKKEYIPDVLIETIEPTVVPRRLERLKAWLGIK
jgi:hypothetical protein